MDIDFVIPWVDGNDPAWIASRQLYESGQSNNDNGKSIVRFRDWGLLRYWFRGVEEFAPWVHRIFFITCGQRPAWLNTTHPKIIEMTHADYIPDAYLPTFNSNVIELHAHRISELSEHFVLFNDDTFITAPTTPDDFFSPDGKPRATAILSYICSPRTESMTPYSHLNNSAIINEHFKFKDTIKKHRNLFFSPKYGKNLLNNILFSRGNMFSKFHSFHIPNSYLKTTFKKVWEEVPELLEKCSMGKFRSKDDLSQYLMQMWQFAEGNFSPRNAKFGRTFVIGEDPRLTEAIKLGSYKTICANDELDDIDFDRERALLDEAFSSILPNKSSFEL